VLSLADAPGGLVAVHFRHLAIHQDEIEIVTVEHGEGFDSAGGDFNLAA